MRTLRQALDEIERLRLMRLLDEKRARRVEVLEAPIDEHYPKIDCGRLCDCVREAGCRGVSIADARQRHLQPGTTGEARAERSTACDVRLQIEQDSRVARVQGAGSAPRLRRTGAW